MVPTSKKVLRYAEATDEFGFTPYCPKFLSIPLRSEIISTALLAIVENNDKPCVDLLLKAGADVTMGDIHGATALGYAAYYGRGNIVDTLIKAGADVNNSGENGITPLFLAVQAGHNKSLEKLLYVGANVNAKTSNGFTPLMQAILAGHAQCVDSLILAGAHVKTAVTLKTCNDDIVKVKETAMATVSTYLVGDDVISDVNQKVEDKYEDLKTKDVKFTTLGLAVVADMGKCIPSLLDAGADVNVPAGMKSPLMYAADAGQTKIMDNLLRAGADVTHNDHDGATALHLTARNGHVGCMNRLVKSGTDVNISDKDGYAPLIGAAKNGHDKCVAELIKAGADMNVADDMGNTALMWASMADQYKCVATLIEAGADVTR